jgi:hypothetical protein
MGYRGINWDDESLGTVSKDVIRKIELLVNGRVDELLGGGEQAFGMAKSNIEVGDIVCLDGLQIGIPRCYYGPVLHIDSSELATFLVKKIEDVGNDTISMDEDFAKSFQGMPAYGIGDQMQAPLASLVKLEE